jgi:hypothetical protein
LRTSLEASVVIWRITKIVAADEGAHRSSRRFSRRCRPSSSRARADVSQAVAADERTDHCWAVIVPPVAFAAARQDVSPTFGAMTGKS